MAEGASPEIIDSSPNNDAGAEVICLSTPSVTTEIRTSPFREAQDELLSTLGKALPYAPLEHVLSTCIDLYMQWEFPTGPVICEPMEMRLYDETSFGGLEWPEAQLRRNAFWHLYIGDKSASILQKVPISLHQMCLDTPITTIFDENMACGLMDSAHDSSNVAFEDQLRVGFYLCFRLWYTASEMLIDLNLLTRLQNRSSSSATTSPDTTTLRSSIMQSYFDLTSILHNCPPWIRDPSSSTDTSTNKATARFRTRSFATQKANLFVTLHALRLVLLCRFADRGFAEILGLTNDATMLSLRKVEIASNLLEIVTELPFEALQANGEPCVEKLRQVGVALLEIIHSVTNDAISARAKSLFGTLLDVLVRLNSRVSDELSNDR
ncbi:hypothetical protein COL154_009131 [Colletotrichum chrysophilum]|nr:hypothetical protein KNSL1_009108 [Colletotrichum chrysophilum]KAJ0358505.1 hypothetical protein COL154_009131 [Colletotrichum chrysophilum]